MAEDKRCHARQRSQTTMLWVLVCMCKLTPSCCYSHFLEPAHLHQQHLNGGAIKLSSVATSPAHDNVSLQSKQVRGNVTTDRAAVHRAEDPAGGGNKRENVQPEPTYHEDYPRDAHDFGKDPYESQEKKLRSEQERLEREKKRIKKDEELWEIEKAAEKARIDAERKALAEEAKRQSNATAAEVTRLRKLQERVQRFKDVENAEAELRKSLQALADAQRNLQDERQRLGWQQKEFDDEAAKTNAALQELNNSKTAAFKDWQQVEYLRAEAEKKRACIEKLKAELAQAEQDLQLAEQELTATTKKVQGREKLLHQAQGVADQEAENLSLQSAETKEAAAAVQNARNRVGQAEAKLEAAQHRLRELDNCTKCQREEPEAKSGTSRSSLIGVVMLMVMAMLPPALLECLHA